MIGERTHLTFDALLVLDAIDRAGSFASAAHRLYRVPSAVSYTVHKLEHDLGVVLFDRSGHRAQLTRAGRLLLIEGRELLRRAVDIERMVHQVDAGWETRLVIAVSDAAPRDGIFSLLREFRSLPEHRATTVEFTAESLGACWTALERGQCDLVVGALPYPSCPYRARPLGEVALVLIVAPEHPLASEREPLVARAIARHPLVRHSAVPSLPPHDGRIALSVSDYSMLIDAVRSGAGVGYIPSHLASPEVAAGRLAAKMVADGPTLSLVAARREAPIGRGLAWIEEHLSRFMPAH